MGYLVESELKILDDEEIINHTTPPRAALTETTKLLQAQAKLTAKQIAEMFTDVGLTFNTVTGDDSVLLRILKTKWLKLQALAEVKEYD